MSDIHFHPELPLLDGATSATLSSYVINVADFTSVAFHLATSSSANCTIKAYGSLSEAKPDFSAAQSATNRFDTVDLVKLNDTGTIIAGDTGIVLAGTDENAMYEVNVTNLRWFTVEITAYSAGTISLFASGIKA